MSNKDKIQSNQYWISETYQIVFDCNMLDDGRVRFMWGATYITVDEKAFRSGYQLLDKKDDETLVSAIHRHFFKTQKQWVDEDFDFDNLDIDEHYYCHIVGGHPPELLQLCWDGDGGIYWWNHSGQYERKLADVESFIKLPE